MKFGSTETYVASDDLALAVNAAVTLQRPLLVSWRDRLPRRLDCP
jgi:hypothetical protein